MRNLWAKIGFGAAGIFVVGMMGLTLVRQARTAAAQALNEVVGRVPEAIAAVEAAPARLAALQASRPGITKSFASVPFRLDGETIGVVHSASIRRVRADAVPTVDLEVELTVSDVSEKLDECVLLPLRSHDSDFSGGFRCATPADHDLVTFGRVRFQPLGNSRPLMLTSDQAADLRRGEPFEATADLDGQVKVEARGNRGGLVRLLADEHRAHIRINDELGRDLFRLIADSTGASLRVRDKNGRDIVRLVAGDGRLSLSVDTAGH